MDFEEFWNYAKEKTFSYNYWSFTLPTKGFWG